MRALFPSRGGPAKQATIPGARHGEVPMPPPPVIIRHNFTPDDFIWLWAKYVVGFNERYHCTNCLRGPYSARFSKAKNPRLAEEREIAFDEHVGHSAIYICGVARKGYSSKKNYEHNVHLAIRPTPGTQDTFDFERWNVKIDGGLVLPIPAEEDLDARYRGLSPAYTTCRIFRWASRARLPGEDS
jgi:hypothetical protein